MKTEAMSYVVVTIEDSEGTVLHVLRAQVADNQPSPGGHGGECKDAADLASSVNTTIQYLYNATEEVKS